MRRIRYSVAMSLDGYIAGPQGEFDWIVMDPDIDFREIFSQFDTILMGRRTYEPMAAGGDGSNGDQSGAGMFSGMRQIVFSRSLKPEDHPDVTIVGDRYRELLDEVRRQPGKDIWLFGGGELFGSLARDGLVDSVEVAVIPVLLGQGIPLLPAPGPRRELKLVGHRIYDKTGTVWLEYEVRATGDAGSASKA